MVKIGTKIAIALHDLHRQHVVHLDVKPSNVMFRPGPDGQIGDAVLIDFGLARHAHLPDLLEEEFELPMGTAPYMSPEQVQFVRSDPRSDLFALGVTLYHLATGARAFGNPSNVAGLRRRLYRDPVPPRALRPDCPPWLQEIILRCLDAEPNRRHQSAAQLAFDLQNPDQVVLTDRAERRSRHGALRSPIVLAAVDVAAATAALLQAQCQTVQRVMQTEPGARLACVAVMKTHRIAMDEPMESDGSSKHVNLLVQLKHWARPLVQSLALERRDEDARVTFHVLEAADVAAAIIEFARKNQVDHIVIGARSSSMLRRYLGSVSTQVVAESGCNVTVVRATE